MIEPEDSPLVRRYRALLRILPRSYRAAREEEMVATFADGLDGGEEQSLGRPSRAETAGVVALATRTWLGGAGAPARLFTWGQAVRVFALVGVLAQAVIAGAELLGFLGVLYFGSAHTRSELRMMYGHGRMLVVTENLSWGLLETVWVPVFVAVLYGRRRTARLLVLLPVAVTLLQVYLTRGFSPWTEQTATLIPVLAPALAMAVGFHRDAPPVRPALWLAALPVGMGALLASAQAHPLVLPDFNGMYCWLTAGAGIACVVARRVAPSRVNAHWPLGLALFGALALVARSLTYVNYARMAGYGLIYVQSGSALVMTCVLLVLAARTFPRTEPSEMSKSR